MIINISAHPRLVNIEESIILLYLEKVVQHNHPQRTSVLVLNWGNHTDSKWVKAGLQEIAKSTAQLYSVYEELYVRQRI